MAGDATRPLRALLSMWGPRDDRPMTAIGRLEWIEVDCADPVLVATFWGKVLGVGLEPALEDPVQYQRLQLVSAEVPRLIFQRVPEPKTVKNRLHLDVAVDDVESATAAIETLAGRRLPGADFEEDGFRWRVMADPEGNEFCLIFAQP